MKPLSAASLTIEDCAIWDRLVERSTLWRWSAVLAALAADRRDAYVMLFLESSKANGCNSTLTRTGQLYGFIGSFVRLPAIPPRDGDYA